MATGCSGRCAAWQSRSSLCSSPTCSPSASPPRNNQYPLPRPDDRRTSAPRACPGGHVYPRRGDAPRPSGGDGGRMSENYDVIIIGSGAGGGTLAHSLAGSGKNILLLERGNFLPRELDNWDPKQVFVTGKYISKD